MGIFSDKQLSDSQIQNLNKLLPEKLRKAIWKESDFGGDNNIYNRVSNYINSYEKELIKLNKKHNLLKDSTTRVIANNIKMFNTELFDAKPLGMVDVGVVEKFSGPTTGDRFAAGAIGYAIEKAIDDSFIEGNKQEEAVNNTKFKLITKARAIYPECNMLFKYEIDFRELGSSGNVFIYMRGTAAIGKNDLIEKGIINLEKEISSIENKIENLKVEIEELIKAKVKIPQDKWGIKKLL